MDMLPLVYLEKKCMYIYKVCLHELHSLTDVYLLEEEELTKKITHVPCFFYCFFLFMLYMSLVTLNFSL